MHPSPPRTFRFAVVLRFQGDEPMSGLPSFDRPFGAGSSAEFIPGYLAIDFALTRQQIHDLNPGQLSQALVRSSPDETRSKIHGSLPWPTKQFFAVRAHEQDHLRRMLSTTFGFLGDAIRCMWLSLSGRLIEESASRSERSLFPLLGSLAPVANHFNDALLGIGQNAAAGSHTATLVRGLADLLEGLTDNLSPPRFASALWGLSNGQPEQVRLLSSGMDLSSPVCSAYPVVDRNGMVQGLSARHLLELFAIGEHGNGFLRTGSVLNDVETLLLGSQQEYALATLVWQSVFPGFQDTDVDSQPRRDDDLIFDWYRLFPFELFVAADLALWPPYFPNEDLSVEGELHWLDIDPGRRFVRILTALVDLKIPPTPIPAENRNERFLELQERICLRLGWPTPNTLAKLWLDNLNFHLRSGTSPWFALDGASTYRTQNAAKLMALRLASPADLILNNIGFQKEGVLSSPIWIFREDDNRRALVSMGEGEPELVSMMMLEGTRHLFNRDRLALSPAYDARFRVETVETVGRMFAKINGWDSALLERFLGETHNAFRTKAVSRKSG